MLYLVRKCQTHGPPFKIITLTSHSFSLSPTWFLTWSFNILISVFITRTIDFFNIQNSAISSDAFTTQTLNQTLYSVVWKSIYNSLSLSKWGMTKSRNGWGRACRLCLSNEREIMRSVIWLVICDIHTLIWWGEGGTDENSLSHIAGRSERKVFVVRVLPYNCLRLWDQINILYKKKI